MVQRVDGEQAPSSTAGPRERDNNENDRLADLQIDACERPLAAHESQVSEETHMPLREIVKGVRRPTKSGSEERPLPPDHQPREDHQNGSEPGRYPAPNVCPVEEKKELPVCHFSSK